MDSAPARRASWPRRLLRLLLVASVCGAAALAALAWRIVRAPLEVGFVVPALERALSRPERGITARIATLELAWDAAERHPMLRARDVRLVDARGETVVRLAEIAVRPSGRALLHGTFAPRTIELIAPRVRISRAPDRGVALDVGDSQQAGGVLHGLLAEPAATGPARWLRRIEVREGDVLVADAASGLEWHALDARVDVERRAGGITLASSASIRLPDRVVPIRAELVYQREPAGVVGTVHFDGLDPSAATSLVPEGALRSALARIALPLDGSVHVELDGGLDLRGVRVEAAGGPGRMVVPEAPAGEITARHVRLSASFDADRLRVETLALDLGRAAVALTADVAELDGRRHVEVEATIHDLTTRELTDWWPRDFERGARKAVTERVGGGGVRSATVRVSGDAAGGRFALAALTGSAAFDGVVARIREAGCEARGVAGTLHFTRDRWHFRVARGAVEDLAVAHGALDLDMARRRGNVTVAVRGPAATGLSLARRAGQRLAIEPADVRGTMTADLGVGFPLSREARSSSVDVTVTAAAHDAGVARVFRGWSLAEGDVALDVRGGTVKMSGHGRVEGAPVEFVWHEDARGRRVEVTTRLDSGTRAALGLDLRPWLEGDVPARVKLVDQAGAGTVDVSADLARASLDVLVLGLRKPPGDPGNVETRVRLADGRPRAVERFRATAAGATATARAELAPDGRAIRTLDGALTLPAADPRRPPVHLTLTLAPDGGRHRFALGCDDAGAMFRALESGSDAKGGRLDYVGTVELESPGLPLDGRLALQSFTLTRAPLLARVTTLASVRGIANALERNGIRFDSLDADIAVRDGKIGIGDALARGPALNVRVTGTVDRTSATCDIHGTLVPSYAGLNAAPGRVPVVGRVLTGGEEKAIQAVDFTITGPLQSPRVSVNPLSLAPAALRDLFRRAPRR